MVSGNAERITWGLVGVSRLVDGLEGHGHAVVLQILQEEHGVVAFFLGLNGVPVGKTIKVLVTVIVGDVEIKISAVEFLIDLFVEQSGYFLIHKTSSFQRITKKGMYFMIRSSRNSP